MTFGQEPPPRPITDVELIDLSSAVVDTASVLWHEVKENPKILGNSAVLRQVWQDVWSADNLLADVGRLLFDRRGDHVRNLQAQIDYLQRRDIERSARPWR
jgi:hypothetical protein